MTDKKNITIALLCVSAALLVAVLCLVNYSDNAAYADTMARGGGYIVVTGSVSPGTEMIYIIDVAAQKMNAYGATGNNAGGSVALVDQVDLKQAIK
jgi:hypothetical protein